MNLIIEIDTIKNCIEELRSLSRWYASYVDVFSPGNFSVPVGSKLSSKLNDICNNYRNIQINLIAVAQFLEYYVNDLETVESRMAGLGSVKSFESVIPCPSVSESSGLIEKPYVFSNTKVFEGMYNVSFTDKKVVEDGTFYSEGDLAKIASCEVLIINNDVKSMLNKYGISEKEALEAIHKASGGLRPGDRLANGNIFTYGMVYGAADLELTVKQSIFINAYSDYHQNFLLDNQYKDAQKSKEESDAVIAQLAPIEKKLNLYGYNTFEAYQSEKNQAYNMAINEVKRNIDYYRNTSDGIAILGISTSEIARLSDDEVAKLVLERDKNIGVNYQRLVEIGNKVGYNTIFQDKLVQARLLNSQSINLINVIEQKRLAIPYEKIRNTNDFKNFTYEIPKTKVNVEISEAGFYTVYDGTVDEYSFYKAFKSEYKNSSDYQVSGISNYEAIRDLESIAERYPELEKEYYYILQNKGKVEAQDYLKDMTGTFAQLAGELYAANRLEYLDSLPEEQRGMIAGNMVKTFGFGVGDGIDGWVENIGHINDKKKYNSSYEWERIYFMTALSSMESKEQNGFIKSNKDGLSSVSKVIDYSKDYGKYSDLSYLVGQGVGNQIPAMALGYAFSPLSAGAGQFASLSAMGAGGYGNTYHQMRVQGYSEEQAHKEALLTAGAEVITEKLYGGLPFTDSGPVYNLQTFLTSMGKEGLQEVLQDFNEPLIHYYVTGEITDLSDVNWSDLLHEKGQTFFVGAMISGILNISGSVLNASTIKVNQNNLNLIGSKLNAGDITNAQATKAVNDLLNIGELSNNDIKSILKIDKNGVSKLTASKTGTVDSGVSLMLTTYTEMNNIKKQQQKLIDNIPGLNELLQKKNSNSVDASSQGVASALIKYNALEKSYENMLNFLKGRSVNPESIVDINRGLNELLKNEELMNIINKKNAGERIVVPSSVANDFETYNFLKSQLLVFNSNRDSSISLASNEDSSPSIPNDADSSLNNNHTVSNSNSIVSSITPIDKIKGMIQNYKKNHNLSFFEQLESLNNRYNPTTVGELKSGIIESIPEGLSTLEKARYVYIALSKQLGFDENLQSNPAEKSYLDTYNKYNSITDDSVLNNKTVCVSWARIYSNILTQLGIENRYQSSHHAWVEFNADGIIIKADATAGNITDLVNVKLNNKTDNFYPINDYSVNPAAGKIAYRILVDPSSPGSFDAALEQIDKNINYIIEGYNNLDNSSIVNDTSSSIVNKFAEFSNQRLKNMDFVGARSLLLDFIADLKKGGISEISGNDMIHLNKDGTMDILNITSLLDENGLRHFFALHDGLGLKEVSINDLQVLQNKGYMFGKSGLEGYNYNFLSGAIGRAMNSVVSKVENLISSDVAVNTGAAVGSLVSKIISYVNDQNVGIVPPVVRDMINFSQVDRIDNQLRESHLNARIYTSRLDSNDPVSTITVRELLPCINADFEKFVQQVPVNYKINGYSMHGLVGAMKNLIDIVQNKQWFDLGLTRDMINIVNRCVAIEKNKYNQFIQTNSIFNYQIPTISYGANPKTTYISVSTLINYINNSSLESVFMSVDNPDVMIDNYTVYQIVDGMKKLVEWSAKNNLKITGLTKEAINKINQYSFYMKRLTFDYSDIWRFNNYNKFQDVLSDSYNPVSYTSILHHIINLLKKAQNGSYSALVHAWNKEQVFPEKVYYDNYWGHVASNNHIIYIQDGEVRYNTSINDVYKLASNSFVHVRNWVGSLQGIEKLYLNITIKDAYRILPQYMEECEKRGLKFYYKTAAYTGKIYDSSMFNRDESVVFYIHKSDMVHHYNLISQLLSKNNVHIYNPPVLAAWLPNGLGYGEEPNMPVPGLSYNKLRSYLVRAAYDAALQQYGNVTPNSLLSFIVKLSSRYRVSPNAFYKNY